MGGLRAPSYLQQPIFKQSRRAWTATRRAADLGQSSGAAEPSTLA